MSRSTPLHSFSTLKCNRFLFFFFLSIKITLWGMTCFVDPNRVYNFSSSFFFKRQTGVTCQKSSIKFCAEKTVKEKTVDFFFWGTWTKYRSLKIRGGFQFILLINHNHCLWELGQTVDKKRNVDGWKKTFLLLKLSSILYQIIVAKNIFLPHLKSFFFLYFKSFKRTENVLHFSK